MAKPSVREAIVTAAADRFHALGYSACGVQEIVDTAGVPKGSFYNYFKTKESLAVEVLANYWTAIDLDRLADDGVAPLARIRGHFEHVAGLYESWGLERGCLTSKFLQEISPALPLLQQTMLDALVRWITLVATAIKQGQAAGAIAPGIDAFQAARFLVNSWGGAASAIRMTRDRAPLDDFMAVAFSAVLHR